MEESFLKKQELEVPKEPDLTQESPSKESSVESLQERAPEDFRRASSLLLETLETQQKTVEEGYMFTYGTFREKTSKGKELDIDSLTWHEGVSMDFEKAKERLVLVAKDSSTGKVVGLRLSDIKDTGMRHEEDGDITNTVQVTGEVLTRYRGEGIATALDTAFEKALTKVAEKYSTYAGTHEIQWKVQNRHAQRLEEAKQKDPDVSLEDINAEQHRWQSLYGEGGKFGLKKVGAYEYNKVIEPQTVETEISIQKPVDVFTFRLLQEQLKEVSR